MMRLTQLSCCSTSLLPFLLIFLSILGCAGVKKPAPTVATIPGVSEHFRIGQILDLKSGKAISFEQLIDQISSTNLIFVGEAHDNPDHHLIEVQILQALMSCCGPVTVAMEFFQEPKQEILDRYIQGELTEDEFLKEVDWKGGWGFDYHLYRPLMLLARQYGSRVLAINAPKDIVKKVAREGLENLDETDRNKLPKEIDLSQKAHRNFVREAYEQHGHKDLKRFEYFYEAQCVWEDTMAHNLSEYLKENSQKLVVFTGNGHIIRKFGIPDRAIRRFPVSMVTIMPYALDETVSIEKETADYVWLTGRRRIYFSAHSLMHGSDPAGTPIEETRTDNAPSRP